MNNYYYLGDTLQNLLVQSENQTTSWSSGGTIGVTNNTETAPDGTVTADILNDTDASSASYRRQGVGISLYDSANAYTLSAFCKKDTSKPRSAGFASLVLEYSGSTEEFNNLDIDYSNGDFYFGGAGRSDSDEIMGGVHDYGTYYRAWITAKSNDALNTVMACRVYPNRGSGNDWTYIGSLTGDGVFWGFQINQGAFPGPYTITTSDAVEGPLSVVQVYPDWNYKEGSEKVESRHRTRDGSEFVYKWGDIQRRSFGVTYVDSSFKAKVNSWWGANSKLRWFENLDVSSVYLVNRSQPVDQLIKPYPNLFRGKIELGTY